MWRNIVILLSLSLFVACTGIQKIIAPGKGLVRDDANKPNISLGNEEMENDTLPDAKLKVKKNEYFGEKTKKAFSRSDSRTSEDYRTFHVLREPHQVDTYVREIFYHDLERGAVVAVVGKGQTLANLLHGPYERTIDEVVVAKGMFYYGMKHGTWLYQRRDSTLYDKEHYNKGWLRDAEITYFDASTKTKIKEVIPYQYGKKEGNYYRFYPSGNIAVRGLYENDYKVGIWEEFYDLPGLRGIKKEIQYARRFYEWDFEPFIRREWDRNYKEVYTSTKLNQ